MQAAQPQDPYRAMLRVCVLAVLPVVAVAVAVSAVVAGWSGVAGSLVGAALVMVSSSSTLAVMSRASRTARPAPYLVMSVALCLYLGKVLVLGLLLVLVQSADLAWLSTTAFAATAIPATAVWLAAEMWAFSRVRTLVFDGSGQAPGTSARRETAAP